MLEPRTRDEERSYEFLCKLGALMEQYESIPLEIMIYTLMFKAALELDESENEDFTNIADQAFKDACAMNKRGENDT